MSLFNDLRDEWREVRRYKELFDNLVERELQVRYKNSRIGVVWSLANPIMRALILWAVFSFILQVKMPNYSAYILAAFFPWTYFLTGILDAGESVSKQMALVRKVYFPRELLPLATTMANLRHFLLSLCVLSVYLVGLYASDSWKHHHLVAPPLTILLMPLLVAIQTLLIGGIALYISALNVFFEDVKFLTAVVLDLLFYAVPIIYFTEQVQNTAALPEGVRSIVYTAFLLNPFAVILMCYRSFLLNPQYAPLRFGSAETTMVNSQVPTWAILWCAFVCVAVFVGGYRFFNARKWRFVEQM